MSTTRAKQVPQEKKVYNFNEPSEKIPQRILGFSGKIGAGKTSCSNFIHALVFTHLIQNTPYAYVADDGKLMVQDADNHVGNVDVNLKTPEAVQWLHSNIWGIIRNFSCAEYLKKIAMDLFSLPYESVYGTQEQKAAPTHLRWEDMPAIANRNDEVVNYRSGPMSGRDFLEFFGSVMRNIDENCHANGLKKLITTPDPYYGLTHICLIDDIRFANEVNVIKELGGKVVRLTRTSEEGSKNTHESNTALDNFNDFDYIIDNQNLTMDECFAEVMRVLYEEKWVGEVNS